MPVKTKRQKLQLPSVQESRDERSSGHEIILSHHINGPVNKTNTSDQTLAKLEVAQDIPSLPSWKDKKLAEICTLLEASQPEKVLETIRELLSEVLKRNIIYFVDMSQPESLVQELMSIIEPILNRTKMCRSTQSDIFISSMAASLALRKRNVMGLGISDLLPGTLGALLIARVERQSAQIRALLEIATKLSSKN